MGGRINWNEGLFVTYDYLHVLYDYFYVTYDYLFVTYDYLLVTYDYSLYMAHLTTRKLNSTNVSLTPSVISQSSETLHLKGDS